MGEACEALEIEHQINDAPREIFAVKLRVSADRCVPAGGEKRVYAELQEDKATYTLELHNTGLGTLDDVALELSTVRDNGKLERATLLYGEKLPPGDKLQGEATLEISKGDLQVQERWIPVRVRVAARINGQTRLVMDEEFELYAREKQGT